MKHFKKADFLILTNTSILDFGKYKGQEVSSIVEQDPDYLLDIESRYYNDYHLTHDVKHQCKTNSKHQ